MYSLPGNVYIFTSLLFFQGFLVLLVIFFFVDKFFSSRKHRLESETIKQEAYKQATAELESAKDRAQKIIGDANTSAADIISKAQYISTETQKNLQQELSKIVTNLNAQIKAEFDNEKVTTLAGFNTILKDLKDESVKQLSSYTDILTKNSLDTESVLKAEVEKHLEEIRQRLGKFEQEQMDKARSKAFSTLLTLSKNFFGQTTSINEHEDLIIKLFEEASLKEKLSL